MLLRSINQKPRRKNKMDKPEINHKVSKMFQDIMEKKLDNRFISAGTLIRFRDACIKAGQESKEHFIANRKESDFYNAGFKAGQTQEREDFLEWLNWLWGNIDDTEREQIKVKIEQIERELKK